MDNIIINNKQFIYTLCNNIYKFLNTDIESERKLYKEIITNIFRCLDSKCSIYNTLERIINSMQDQEQETNREDIDDSYNNSIHNIIYIENDFILLKDKLITDQEKKELNELKIINQEREYNNNDINKIQSKYNDIISSILFDEDKTKIKLIDGEEIALKNNDRLIII